MIAHRRGALERVALLLEDRDLAGERIGQAEQRMTAVLDELGPDRPGHLDHRDLCGRRCGDIGRDRHLHAVITTGQSWDPLIATHGTWHNFAELAA